MDNLTELKQGLVDYFKLVAGFPQADIRLAHPAAQRDFPLKNPVVAVGLEQVEIAPAGLGGYLGADTQGDEALWGSGADITLRLDVYCPAQDGGQGCHRIYEAICGSLLMGRSRFGVQKVWCGQLGWNKDACANLLPVFATLRAALTQREEGQYIKDFRVIRNPEKE